MSVELKMLVWSSVLLFLLVIIQATASSRKHGLKTLAGNRGELGPPGEFEARAKRLVANHIENLAIFAPLLLAEVAMQATGGHTALAATLFFWGRLAHAALYLVGVPWVRTAAFIVSTVGLVLLILVDLHVVAP